MIKSAQHLEYDLDAKSLLALCLVLLKQVQPYVTDFEEHETIFHQSMMQASTDKSLFNPGISTIRKEKPSDLKSYPTTKENTTNFINTSMQESSDNQAAAFMKAYERMQNS
jgi:hypothetical protein